ncbi:MAG: 3-methyl-2-oxobutanoate hydroxymethyltransferase [Acidobacteriota bacterium]
MEKINSEKITVPCIIEKKKKGEKIVCLTAYDYPTAKLLDESEIDIILVGDSVGNVILGYSSTIPVSMEEMLHHTKAVARGIKNSLLIADMPYPSFHIKIEDSVKNATRFIKAGAEGVKIEGGKKRVPVIKAMLDAEIPVMGHLGLTPQSIHKFGGYKVQGKEFDDAKILVEDALILEEAGVFSIVLESIPLELAEIITKKLKIPTIGIGAGPYCDGQILVFHDLVGLSPGYLPKFVRKYLNLQELISKAIRDYSEDVKNGKFPGDSESYHLKEEIKEKLMKINLWKHTKR